jgi:tetratricopeptide (TPR) repeat protein
LQRSSPSNNITKRTWRGTTLICAALFISTLAVYRATGHFDFVNYDDPDYVTANPHVAHGLTHDSLVWALTSNDAANWFPVTRLSYLMDAQLFGTSSGAEHLVNVFFHACAAILVFLFLRAATNCLWPSGGVAWFFALHPLHVESVAWISERKDVLCAVFFLATLCAYVWYLKRLSVARYLVVAFLFALALISKPMAVTLPFVLLLIDFWPLKRGWKWMEKVPLFLLAAAASAITYLVQQQSGAVKALANFPLSLRLENAFASYAIYLGQTFWPARLAVFYPFRTDIPVWQPVLGALLLIGGFAAAYRFRDSRPYLLTGWLWFVIMLLPVIGLVQVGAQSHADRYMYLPMIGLLIIVLWAALDAVRRWPSSRNGVVLFASAVCTVCAIMAAIQIGTWKNSGTLFEHALAVTQDNYIAEHNLGTYLLDQPGQLASATAHLQRALQINPDSAQARSDLGIALAKSGHLVEAEKQFKTAVALQPNAQQPRQNLQAAAQEHYQRGVQFMKANNIPQAIAEFQAAVRMDPGNAEAHNNLGVAYSSEPGHLPQAMSEFEAAIRINPDYIDAQYNVGAALAQTPGREREALAHLQIVERLRPDPEVEKIIRQLSAQNPAH